MKCNAHIHSEMQLNCLLKPILEYCLLFSIWNFQKKFQMNNRLRREGNIGGQDFFGTDFADFTVFSIGIQQAGTFAKTLLWRNLSIIRKMSLSKFINNDVNLMIRFVLAKNCRVLQRSRPFWGAGTAPPLRLHLITMINLLI